MGESPSRGESSSELPSKMGDSTDVLLLAGAIVCFWDVIKLQVSGSKMRMLKNVNKSSDPVANASSTFSSRPQT